MHRLLTKHLEFQDQFGKAGARVLATLRLWQLPISSHTRFFAPLIKRSEGDCTQRLSFEFYPPRTGRPHISSPQSFLQRRGTAIGCLSGMNLSTQLAKK